MDSGLRFRKADINDIDDIDRIYERTHDVEEAVFLSNRILAVEHSPIRELREYRVPLSYPRTESALAAPEALALKEQLIRLFREAGK